MLLSKYPVFVCVSQCQESTCALSLYVFGLCCPDFYDFPENLTSLMYLAFFVTVRCGGEELAWLLPDSYVQRV